MIKYPALIKDAKGKKDRYTLFSGHLQPLLKEYPEKEKPTLYRRSFAIHLLEEGKDIRYVQELPGHKSIKTTERYTHIVNDVLINVSIPFDV